MESFDDFCLPDEVFMAVCDLLPGAPPLPQAGLASAAPALPAPQPAVAAPPSMFEVFLPPGPLPLVPPAAILSAAPSLAAPAAAPAHSAGGAAGASYHAALGEAQVVRARMAQVEAELQQERNRVGQMAAELQALRGEKNAGYETEIRRLSSELIFKEDEVVQAMAAKAQLQKQLDELQSNMLQGHGTYKDPAATGQQHAMPPPKEVPAARAVPGSVAPRANPRMAVGSAVGGMGPITGTSPLFHSRSMRPSPSASSTRKRQTAGDSSPGRAPLPDGATIVWSTSGPPPPAAPAPRTAVLRPACHAATACHAAAAQPPPHCTIAPPPAAHVPASRSCDHVGVHPDEDTPVAELHDTSTPKAVAPGMPTCWPHTMTPHMHSPFEPENRARRAAASDGVAPVAAVSLDSSAQQGMLLVSRLLARSDSNLRRLVFEPTLPTVRDALEGVATLPHQNLASRLLLAVQLLLTGGEASAPLLVQALSPHLVLPAAATVSGADTLVHASWRLLSHLLIESDSCRQCVLRGWLTDPSASHDEHTHFPTTIEVAHGCCVEVLPGVCRLIEHMSHAAEYDLLLPTLRGLSALAWTGTTACLPWLRAWLSSEKRGGMEVAPTFSRLLSAAMPWRVRLESLGLLGYTLQSEEAFEAFATSVSSPWASPATLVALALSARASDGTDKCESGIVNDDDGLGTTLSPEATLRQASLRLLSSLVARHAGASELLLAPALGLALPMRLVSMLQSQVHALLRLHGREPSIGELELVRESVLLLLELARGPTSMQQALEGGSWSADLTSATLCLVRNEVHPQLADLSMPAKLLQNAMVRVA